MPDLFVPPDVAASLLAYLETDGVALPAAFADLRSRLNALLVDHIPPETTVVAPPAPPSLSAPMPDYSSVFPRRPRTSVRRSTSVPLPDSGPASPDFIQSLRTRTLAPLPELNERMVDQAASSKDPSDPYIPSPSQTLRGSSPLLSGSSPTLHGDDSSLHRFLSPLLLSPVDSVLGKRTSQDREEEHEDGPPEDEEEEEEVPQTNGAPSGLMIKFHELLARHAAGAGGGGDGGGAGGGGGPAHLWTPECGRRGDRERTGSDAAIGAMPCHQPDCPSCQGGDAGGEEEPEQGSGRGKGQGVKGKGRGKGKGSSRKKAKTVGYRVDPDGGPAITEGAGKLLSRLLAIFGRAHRQDLEKVLNGIGVTSSSSFTPNDMVSLCARISQQTTQVQVGELQLMLSLIQLGLNVDSLRAEATSRITFKKLTAEYAPPGTHENTFRDWVNHSKKLILLCAGGTLYLLPIIAALNLRTFITRQ
ncbi:hypothetical protein C8R46DRAFT_1196774, partial [Mycena filopes]